MIKSILFIYLELFTLRYAHIYSKQRLSSFRELFIKIISNNDFDSISPYLSELRFFGSFLSAPEYCIVKDFHRYLSRIDKIINM